MNPHLSIAERQQARARWANQQRLCERSFGDQYPGRPVVERAGEPYVTGPGSPVPEPWEDRLIARLRGGRVN